VQVDFVGLAGEGVRPVATEVGGEAFDAEIGAGASGLAAAAEQYFVVERIDEGKTGWGCERWFGSRR